MTTRFYKFSESVQRQGGYPPIVQREYNSGRKHFNHLQMQMIADEVFEFVGGNTIYIKDRHNKNYQYTLEEQLILKLGGNIKSLE